MELCTTELFIYVHSKVKPSMKSKSDSFIVKFIRVSEDIIAAALVLLDQVSSVLENTIMLVLLFLI